MLVLTAVLEAHSTAVKEDRNQGVTDEGSDTGTPNVRLAVAAALSFMVSWLGALDSAVPKGGVRHNITTMRLLHTAADAKLLYEQMKKA